MSKALQNVAFQDDGLIQYKGEVMLRIFEKDVKPLIGGRAKAMIVTSSRVAGLRYFNIIKEKADIQEFAAFAECVGPQLVKAGTLSDLMKQIRATVVTKAAVPYLGVMTGGGAVKLKVGKGNNGAGPAPVKVSVQDMIAQIRAQFDITDEQALYIKQVTQEKIADPAIRTTVQAHRDDRPYLEGACREQIDSDIQTIYDMRSRYDELADPKYTDTGGIFDIMAVTVIETHLSQAA